MLTFENFYIKNIKVGNIVELRNKTRWMVVSVNSNLEIQLFNFVDSFEIQLFNFVNSFSTSFNTKLEDYWNEALDIVSIYKIKNDCPISQIFDDQNLLLLWSRIENKSYKKGN